MINFKKRREALKEYMQTVFVDAFLITDKYNLYYFTGFTGDDGIGLITESGDYIITDSRFEQQLIVNNPDIDHVITRNYLGEAIKIMERKKLIAMAFEGTLDYLSYDFLDENASHDLVNLSGVLEQFRSVKDQDEIKHVKRATELSKKGFEHLLKEVEVGKTEKQMVLELDYYMRKNGAQKASFETIFASGSRTAWPHATYTDETLKNGDIITLDFGYYVDGYTSDITRSFNLGKADSKIKEIYQIVLEALNATVAAVKPGVTGKQLDEIGRAVIEKAGYGKYFNHGMGHGIGLDIHELPNIGGSYSDELQPNQIITIEPGIYLPEIGGVRIEDDILVTDNGFENLTDFGKDFKEL